MDFDELQKSWRSQPVDVPVGGKQLRDGVIAKWDKQQKRILWTNIGTTLAFIAVIIDISWVQYAFGAGHGIFFHGSIVAMDALLVIYAIVLWRGYAYQKTDATQNSAIYIDHYLQKLYWRRKTLISFLWVYLLLLWAALMLYILDVTHGGSLLLQVSAPAVTTLYIVLVKFFTRKKTRRQVGEIDALITEMQELKRELNL